MIYKKIDELKPHPKNEYYFDDSENATYKLLKDDIENCGKIRNPILISSNNVIISGHQRYKAYKELGKEKIPCVILDKKYTDDDLEYILIMENITARNMSKAANKIKLGRCIDKICEYCHIENGNNQYSRVCKNSLPSQIRQFNSKKEISEAFDLSAKSMNNYQSLANNGITELQNAVMSKKITTTKGVEISRLSNEAQEKIMFEINSMNKPEVEKIDKIIKEVKNLQPIKEKTTIEGNPIQTDSIKSIETEIDDIQENTDNITFEDIDNYLDYGNGDESELTNINELKSCVNDPVPHMTYFENLEFYHRWILESFKKTKTLFEKNNIHEPTLQELYDELTNYADELEELAENIRWISENYVDTILTVIDDIKDCKDDDEVVNCDEQGYLYNGSGKKIGQIENYNNKLAFDYVDYNEQDDKDYAYDEDDTVIGVIKWFNE